MIKLRLINLFRRNVRTLIGVVVGLVLGGGLLVWANISQEVGINGSIGGTSQWSRLITTVANGLQVDVTRVQGTVAVSFSGSNTPSDSFTNPTNAVPDQSFLMGFNGALWDRLRSTQNGADGVAVSSVGNLQVVAFPMMWNGASFDRFRGDATNGLQIQGTFTNSDAFAAGTKVLVVMSELAGFNGTTWDRTRHSFTQTTTGVAANGAGTSVDMTTTPMSKYTISVLRTAGATDTVNIGMQCSLDNANFQNPVNMPTVLSIAGGFTILSDTSANGVPCLYMRYNVGTVGAGNTLTIRLLAIR